MPNQSAAFYDAIYHWKNYGFEAEAVLDRLDEHAPKAETLLDVACGTGQHIGAFKAFFDVVGLDLDPTMLAIARTRHAEVPFFEADMADFSLDRRFDVITCLFGSIGCMTTLERLGAAIASMARHLNPGGVLIVEPWFTPEAYKTGTMHANFVDRPDLKLARMNTQALEGRCSVLDMHFMVATPAGVTHFTERQELGLFSPEEMRAAFEAAGLKATYEPQGLMGKGLWIGIAPKA